MFKVNNKNTRAIINRHHSGVFNVFNVNYRSSHQRCTVKKVLLKISQNSQENTCARVSFLIKLQAEACNFIKKETLAQVFSCEFCEIFKNTFFRRTPLVAASVTINMKLHSMFRVVKRIQQISLITYVCLTQYALKLLSDLFK